MNRTVMLILMLTFGLCRPVYSHTLTATVYLDANGEKLVVLRDTDTEEEWAAEVGDEIDGYRVVGISDEYVTISKPGEGRVILSTKIPIRGEGGA